MSEKKRVDTKQRATCWSLTLFNDEEKGVHPPGWKLTGQYEECPETKKKHFQGMLKTPQVRFSEIKRQYPRAHIEVARNPLLLTAYVHKENSRVADYTPCQVMNMFQLQDVIAGDWNAEEWTKYWNEHLTLGLKNGRLPDMDDIAMKYVRSLVAKRIESGQRGLEFTSINPMWTTSWKYFWRQIITRHANAQGRDGGSGTGQDSSGEVR